MMEAVDETELFDIHVNDISEIGITYFLLYFKHYNNSCVVCNCFDPHSNSLIIGFHGLDITNIQNCLAQLFKQLYICIYNIYIIYIYISSQFTYNKKLFINKYYFESQLRLKVIRVFKLLICTARFHVKMIHYMMYTFMKCPIQVLHISRELIINCLYIHSILTHK